MKALMSLAEVAEQTPWKVDTIRKAVRATSPVDKDGNAVFPPPLKAKLGPKGQYVVRRQDFEKWIDGLGDA